MSKRKNGSRADANGGQPVKVNPKLPTPGSNPGNKGANVQAPGNNGRNGGFGITSGTKS